MKGVLRQKAIKLRQAGKTYAEILHEIPVAKSTLSEWFKAVHLSRPQKQRITQKRIDAALRGAQKRRQTRLAEMNLFREKGLSDVRELSARELWLIGIALYWAGGTKQYEHAPSRGILFCNSDVRMVRVFLTWLEYMKVSHTDIRFELYVHETRAKDVAAFKKWWKKELDIGQGQVYKTYLKKGSPKTNRRNVGDLYHGLIRIKVHTSTTLNRRISGWIHGIVIALGSGVIGNTSAFEAEDSRIVP